MKSIGIMFAGCQSNGQPAFQLGMLRKISQITACRIPVFGNRNGGDDLSEWISGPGPTYTQGANFLSDINYAAGTRFDVLGVINFHGENMNPISEYASRLTAWSSMMRNALLRPGGVMRTLYCQPHRSDGVNTALLQQVRVIRAAQAASEGADATTMMTDAYPRSDGVHINKPVALANAGPDAAVLIYNLILPLI